MLAGRFSREESNLEIPNSHTRTANAKIITARLGISTGDSARYQERPSRDCETDTKQTQCFSPRVYNGCATAMAQRLEENEIDYEIPTHGVFMRTDLGYHTLVIVDASSASGDLTGVSLVDGTVHQFAEVSSQFADIGVVNTEDARWKRWYTQESHSTYDIPNDGRTEISLS